MSKKQIAKCDQLKKEFLLLALSLNPEVPMGDGFKNRWEFLKAQLIEMGE
jgi:hypothetical protein